jgi:hypothetical protein
VATADAHPARMTSGELLELVRSKLAEVEAYITASSRRRHLLVNLVIIGSILATALTAPAAIGGKSFTNWLQQAFHLSSPSWQLLCLIATIGSITAVVATQVQRSGNYDENLAHARAMRGTLQALDISITAGEVSLHRGTAEFEKCVVDCSFIDPADARARGGLLAGRRAAGQ